ncbi:BAX inhibitor 1 [Actinidia rufa]|uniref:BAX inhibitor 1 n=1 Tax=Actinidia rufa TaxID=165716 RepID=A0A7J0FR05_9ERIC|nr:BAX inhibitor 1 [Actinidia rufa]
MDAISSFFESQSASRNNWSYDSLKNFRQISPVVQTHLKQLELICISSGTLVASLPPLVAWEAVFGCSRHLRTKSILVSAFVGCAVAFGCFSMAAMLARRREYLYLGGLLSSGLFILFWLQFASSVFGGSASLFKFELYFGLLVFVGYIVVDTQDIIEKAHFGDLDYVKHALTLFTDFAAVFVRILIIMLKNSEKNEKKKKRRN